MLGLAWFGSWLSYKHRLARNRFMLWLTFFSFPLPFIAIITGWFTAEVGRQPWVVFGVLRTADAMTPFLTTREATISLVINRGASAPGISTAPITTSASRTDSSIWRLDDIKRLTRPDRISSRWRIRSIERSRIVTFAPRPIAITAAL